MFRTLTITGITAIALAAAPMMVPQASARSDLDRFLIGATAIAIIGAIASDHNKKKRQAITHTYVEPPRHTYEHKHKRKHAHKKEYKKVVTTRTTKPKRCLRQKWRNNGWVTYYGRQCMSKYSRTVKTVRKFYR